MGWARFDDGYTDNPKILDAGPWAELLDMRAIIYCARMETDGLITRSALKRIGHGIPRTAERVNALLEVGRWTVNDGGGYLVHDFLKFNPSKAEKEAQRAAGRERVRKHRLSTGSNASGNAYHSMGRGRDLEAEKQRVRMVERCRRCGKLDVDCECPPLEAVQ